MNICRRLCLVCMPVLLAACISQMPYPTTTVLPAPVTPPAIRPPQVGQQWIYNVRNVFNQEIVDTVTETVVSVTPQIRIQRVGVKAGPMVDEIQESWGMVLQDPHWSPPQRFQTAMPLWPEKLEPGSSRSYQTRYNVVGYPDGNLFWGLRMDVKNWVKINVPAGQFLALQYRIENPYFESNNPLNTGNYREDEMWFAPEIGRWVSRRSYGRYITSGMSWFDAYWENYYQWELVSWR